MPSLNINGWDIPVREGSAGKSLEIIGEQSRSFSGFLITTERAEKRGWKFRTPLIPEADAVAIEGLLRGRGDVWKFDDSLWSAKGQAATFTRASTRYLSTGQEIASGAAGYESGPLAATFPADKAIWVEEGTTNLLTANQASVETDTTGFVAQTASTILSRDITEHWHGTACLKTVAPGTMANEGFVAGIDVAPSLEYTASVWLKGSGSVKLYFVERNAGDVFIGQTSTGFIALTDTWTRYSISRLFGATGVKAQLKVDTSGTSAATFYADGLQIEQKPYATSWHLPGTSRAAESLTIPTSLITPQEGAIWVWVYVNDIAKRRIAGQYPEVFSFFGSGSSRVMFWHSPASANWTFETRNDTNNSSNGSFADSYTPNGWNLFCFKWKLDEAKVSANGVNRVTIIPKLPSSITSALNIGGRGVTSYFNAYFGSVILLPYYPTDAEELAYYQSSRPYSDLPRLNVYGDLVGRPASNPLVCEARIDDMKYRQGASLYREIEFTLMEV